MGILSTAKTIGGSAIRGGTVKATSDGARSLTNANAKDESSKSGKSEAANTTDAVANTSQKMNDEMSSSTAIADMKYAMDMATLKNNVTKACGEALKSTV